jgi:hypothetical protein
MTQASHFTFIDLMGCYPNACRGNMSLILIELKRTLVDDKVNPP